MYLHSLNARCLVREYGSLENSPQQINATIVEKESVFVTEVGSIQAHFSRIYISLTYGSSTGHTKKCQNFGNVYFHEKVLKEISTVL